ncbi:hypothetical protein AB0H12_29550 [Actinosynnema sp. NPDC023794]
MLVKLFAMALAVVVAIIVGIAAGVLAALSKGHPATAILKGGAAFAATLLLEIAVLTALGAFS